MDEEEAQFLLQDEEQVPSKKTRSSDAAAKNRLEKVAVADKKAPTSNSKTIPEKSPRGSNSTRGGKGNKGGKAGAAGSKDKGGKDKDDGKPKITKARSAYNFYLLKRIAQLKAEGEVERHQDRFSQAAGEWRDMSFEERVPYEDMAKTDKDRHQSDLNTASKAVAAGKAIKTAPNHGQGLESSEGFPGLQPLPDTSPHDDVCAVCGEEGNLLCCDFCPKTHHLDCLVPPMQSLPKNHVMWACPACSEGLEKPSVSSPSKKKHVARKEEKKEDKKRPRPGASAAVPSPKGSKEVGGSFTIPKRKKEVKSLSSSGSPRSSKEKKEKRREKEEKRAAREDEAAADGAEKSSNSGSRSSNRMVKGTKQAKLVPRVGLGLSDDATASSSTGLLIGAPDYGGTGDWQDESKKSLKGTSMSFADAAASVAASAAASEAAAAAAAAPVASAPPKALGLKKLLHQRVQYDEIEAAGGNPSSTFSPKKLLKHRILSGNNTDNSQDPINSSESGAGGSLVKTEEVVGMSGYQTQAADGRPSQDWHLEQGNPETRYPKEDPPFVDDNHDDKYVGMDSRGRPEDERYAGTVYPTGGREWGDERVGEVGVVGSPAQVEGVGNGRDVEDGSDWVDKRPVSGASERYGASGQGMDEPYSRGPGGEGGWWGGKERTVNGGSYSAGYEHDGRSLGRSSPADGVGAGIGGRDAMRWSAGRPEARDPGREREFAAYEQGPRTTEHQQQQQQQQQQSYYDHEHRAPENSYRSSRMDGSEESWKGAQASGAPPHDSQRGHLRDYPYGSEAARAGGGMPRASSSVAGSHLPPEGRWDGDRGRPRSGLPPDDPKDWREQPSGWKPGRTDDRPAGELDGVCARDGGVGPVRFSPRDTVDGSDCLLRNDSEGAQHRFSKQDQLSVDGTAASDARACLMNGRRGPNADVDAHSMRNAHWRGGPAHWKAGDREPGIDHAGRGDTASRHAGGNRVEGTWMGELPNSSPRGGSSSSGKNLRDNFGGRSSGGGGGGGRGFHNSNSNYRPSEGNGRGSRGGGTCGGGDGDGGHYGWVGRKRPLDSFDEEGSMRGGPRKLERLQNDRSPQSTARSMQPVPHHQGNEWDKKINANGSANFDRPESPGARRNSRERGRGGPPSSQDVRGSTGVGQRENGRASTLDRQAEMENSYRMGPRQDHRNGGIPGQPNRDICRSQSDRTIGHESWMNPGASGGRARQRSRSRDALAHPRDPDRSRQDGAKPGWGGAGRGEGHWKSRVPGMGGFRGGGGRGNTPKGRGERSGDARDFGVDWKRRERTRDMPAPPPGSGEAGPEAGWRERRDSGVKNGSGGGGSGGSGASVSGLPADIPGRNGSGDGRPGCSGQGERGRDMSRMYSSSRYGGVGGRDGRMGISAAGGHGAGNDRRGREPSVRPGGPAIPGSGGGRGGQRPNPGGGGSSGYNKFMGPKPVTKAMAEKAAGYATLAAQVPSRTVDSDKDKDKSRERVRDRDRDSTSSNQRSASRTRASNASQFPPQPRVTSEIVVKGGQSSPSIAVPDCSNKSSWNDPNRSLPSPQRGGSRSADRSPSPKRPGSNSDRGQNNPQRDSGNHRTPDRVHSSKGYRGDGGGRGGVMSRHHHHNDGGPKPWKNRGSERDAGGGRGRERPGGGFGSGGRGGQPFSYRMDGGRGRGIGGRGGGRGRGGRFHRH